MVMRTLVVGGTGPTGPFIVNGLRERGREVTIFHRGTHEVPEIPDDVTHIHGDPHFAETIAEALDGHTFDEVIASYGRIRLIAEALAGKAGRFVSVGGVPVYRGFGNPDLLTPRGLTAPVAEDAPKARDEAGEHFGTLILQTEEAVFEHHPTATVFRYPYVYGPYQLVPREWCVVRRILDGRRQILLPDGGTQLSTHAWAGNLGHAVLAAIDQPEASAGKAYNCGDVDQLTLTQIVEVIGQALGSEIQPVAVPWEVAGPAKAITPAGRHHLLLDLSQLRGDLGYTDALPAPKALAQVARWYVDNPPDVSFEERLGDPFDYAWEDRMLEQLSSTMAQLRQASRREGDDDGLAVNDEGGTFRPHPYAHPKDAGQLRDQRGR
ncbi:MAG: NAD-dependent epimerase/dehydratase family protein [Acidimicrobiia bacterium]|nr:NAD-dependent epimerase/dehydratase family protein [Acidimicrobiia bacterium]MDH4365738.1 NAD-dependent epimerase/dehydratase family protein [Acidimicrobiia bacterium]